jgi:PAS domain S-box-containing protein/putative nucleotidyltransferase with HDIG domain
MKDKSKTKEQLIKEITKTGQRAAELEESEAKLNKILTEIQKSENHYRLIFDSIGDAIHIIDRELRIIIANKAFTEWIKVMSIKADIVGLKVFEAFPFLKEIVKGEYEQVFKTGKPLTTEECNTLDGRKIYTESRKIPVMEEDRVVQIITVIRDITERKRSEEQLHQTLDSLKKAVGTTIQVLVSALESRDPYTAGHQLRVSHLACAIAEEMGIVKEKVDGIRLAGSIHDIGKISIPTEILAKPTKLSKLEFSLIKEHSQIGYEMLKHVESPWPLAQIVHQHHERIDGSGYPNKLSGNEIIIEARIMAVADVVEAMASHRPYRASLGIELALEEIKKNKGIIFDDVVVDACLRLFLEKGYQLAEC